MPIVDLSGYKSRKELESYATSLFTQVAILQSKLTELEAKEAHLQELLKNSNVPSVAQSEEETLLLREIRYLDNISRTGGLTLDETKQLNLLISCLVSVRKGEKIEDKKGASKKVDKAKLLELVRAKTE